MIIYENASKRKKIVCIGKELKSRRISLVHQHGCHSVALVHQNGFCDLMGNTPYHFWVLAGLILNRFHFARCQSFVANCRVRYSRSGNSLGNIISGCDTHLLTGTHRALCREQFDYLFFIFPDLFFFLLYYISPMH